MAPEVPLDRVQRWMQKAVVHPGSVKEALAAASRVLRPARLGDVILPSRTLTAAQRVGIYQGMYPLRMEEALETDYPKLKRFLGDEAFRRLVNDYVAAFPSRSYTLNRLGDHLPEFLRRAPGLKHRGFCRELARLELAMTQVYDEAETPSLSAAAVAAVPPDAWATLRLRPIAAFRLLALRHPVSATLQRRGKARPRRRPPRQDEWVAVFRHDYRVRRLELSRSAYRLLSSLAAGRPLGQAVAAAVRRGGKDAPRPAQLRRWFRQWVANGIFMGLEGLEPSTSRL